MTIETSSPYFSKLYSFPLLTAEEELHYIKLAIKGDIKARNKIIQSSLWLVIKIARNYTKRGVPFIDLVGEGNIGLIKAIDKFDPDRGFRFSTCAVWWVKAYIKKAIREQTRVIYLPTKIVQKYDKCLKAEQQLSQELSRDYISTEDIAKKMNKPFKEIKELLLLIDTFVDYNENKDLVEAVINEDEDTEENINRLEQALDQMPKIQRQIIIKRFGLYDSEIITLREIGKDLGLSKESVRQLQIKAIKTLQNIFNAEEKV